MSAGPQPTDHEVVPGCSLTRRQALQVAAATGAASIGATASSGPAAAQTFIPTGVGWGSGNALGWLFGSGDDEEVQEYTENELLRAHGDAHQTAYVTNASGSTNRTWFADNVNLLEGRAYIEGLKQAYKAIQDENATRQEAIDAASAEVDEVYSTPAREYISEYHLHWQRIMGPVDRMKFILDERDQSYDLADYVEIRNVNGASNTWDDVGINSLSFDASNEVTYTLFNGETVSRPSLNVDAELREANNSTSVFEIGLAGLRSFDRGSTSSDGFAEIEQFRIKPFDDAEYRNVYDSNYGEDGEADSDAYAMSSDWYETETALVDAHSTAVTNVETMIDNVYEQIVDDEISYADIQSFSSLAADAPEDDPHALVNAHLAMLGQTPTTTYNSITIGPLTDPDGTSPEPNDNVAAVEGETLSGTLYVDPGPDEGEGLTVGETYTPSGLTDMVSGTTVAPTVLFSATIQTENDGETVEQTGFVELEDTREFTVESAQALNENGDIEDVDTVTFSDDDLTTETPTDYQEVHSRLDEYEQFQQDLLERQMELVEQMADDNNDDSGWGLPSFGGFGGGGLVGLGIIGIVVLAVVGIVTDLIPGLGE